jgi:hypothetical protein
VLHGDRKPPSVFLVTTLVLGRWICIVGECLSVTPHKSYFEKYVNFSLGVEFKYIFHKNYLTFEVIHPKTMFPN